MKLILMSTSGVSEVKTMVMITLVITLAMILEIYGAMTMRRMAMEMN